METWATSRLFRLSNHFAASNLGAKSCTRYAGKRQTAGHTAVPTARAPGPKFSGQHGVRPNGVEKASQADQHNQCYGCESFGHKFKNCHQTRFQMPVFFCGRKHPSDTPCSTQKNYGVYKAHNLTTMRNL